MPGDDNMNDPIRSPDDPASPAELAQAESFAGLVDQLLAGESPPPAMASDERALVEVAAIMRAGVHEVELVSARRDALIDDALSQAMARAGAGPAPQTATSDAHADVRPDEHADTRGDAPGDSHENVIDLGARQRRKLGKIIPWSLAAAAAAAALFFALQRPAQERISSTRDESILSLSSVHRSRPADALIGQIPRDRAERASDRLDVIYSDRMAGYRDLRLRGGYR